MLKALLACAAFTSALVAAGSASALTCTSYRDGLAGPQTPYG